jgi:hypothetical protein
MTIIFVYFTEHLHSKKKHMRIQHTHTLYTSFELSKVLNEKNELASITQSLNLGFVFQITNLTSFSTFICDQYFLSNAATAKTLFHTNRMLQRESVFS